MNNMNNMNTMNQMNMMNMQQRQMNMQSNQNIQPNQNMQRQNYRIFFYSKKCKASQNLIIFLTNMQMLQTFQMVCIDEMKANQIPQGITQVPALVLPEINSIFQGKDCFMWVDRIRTNFIKQNIMQNQVQNGIHGYITLENEGTSDKFAYTSTDIAQPKSFLPYGEDEKYSIYTGTENKKITALEQKKLIDTAQRAREDFDKNVSKIYDQMRENVVIDMEKQKIIAKQLF